MEKIESYDYPKQIILNEVDGTKIYKKLGNDETALEVDDYNWQIVSTITEKIHDEQLYTLIQHEDSRLGWINFRKSIQVFRFEPVISRFIDEDFEVHEINEKLGINKDFQSHFVGKLLSIKSEIVYDGQRLLGVFVKDKFFGFHDEKFFEKLIDCNFELPKKIISEKDLYKTSKMKEATSEEVNVNKPVLISIFKKSNIGKVKVNNKDYYWIYLDKLESFKEETQDIVSPKNTNQKHIDDLFYAIKKERQHSKEIVKTVLSLKDYIKTRKANGTLDYDLATNKELLKELDNMKMMNEKLNKHLRLSETRLEQQRDYNKRLEAQKDKYKDRMNFLEQKFKKFKDQQK